MIFLFLSIELTVFPGNTAQEITALVFPGQCCQVWVQANVGNGINKLYKIIRSMKIEHFMLLLGLLLGHGISSVQI